MNTIADILEKDSDAYRVKLEHFEGPLDLLLHLIKTAKISIEQIFISEITSQYLELMSDIQSIDMDRASEFLEMAANLLEIKSKALLPKPPQLEDVDDSDPAAELVRRLEEYKIFKEASEKMRSLEVVNMHHRAPDPSVGNPTYVLGEMTITGMMQALSKLFSRLVDRPISTNKKIMLDRFTVADKIVNIKGHMAQYKKAVFEDFFEADYTKGEIITTFLALLELLKLQSITVSQEALFSTIHIEYVEEFEASHGQLH